jgi:hypothetical protein
MNQSINNSKIEAVKDTEATSKLRLSSDSNSSKTAVSLGDKLWKYQGKTYQEKSLSSSVGSFSQKIHSNHDESPAKKRATQTGFQRNK